MTSPFLALSDIAVSSDSEYTRLCDQPIVDHVALDAQATRSADSLRRLAELPASSTAEIAAKARALQTCVWPHKHRAPSIEGDEGLAASLIKDILRHG